MRSLNAEEFVIGDLNNHLNFDDVAFEYRTACDYVRQAAETLDNLFRQVCRENYYNTHHVDLALVDARAYYDDVSAYLQGICDVTYDRPHIRKAFMNMRQVIMLAFYRFSEAAATARREEEKENA